VNSIIFVGEDSMEVRNWMRIISNVFVDPELDPPEEDSAIYHESDEEEDQYETHVEYHDSYHDCEKDGEISDLSRFNPILSSYSNDELGSQKSDHDI
jgi:hypothetical protein